MTQASELVRTFRKIYEETMQRVGASSYYFFPKEYYRALSCGMGRQMAVAIAMHGEEAVGGALFFAGEHFAHYHLSGTTTSGRSLKANTLILAAGAEWARRRGCELLHLGGGVAQGDSLYQFKKSFGGITFLYSFMTVIANSIRYDELVESRRTHSGMGSLRAGFFPEYRA
jgi:hypothetical protein